MEITAWWAVSLKLGAWVSYGLGSIELAGAPLVLPGYIGAMIVGIALRSSLELTGRPWIRDRVVALMMFLCLNLFLAVAAMSVDLAQLAHVAIPMLVILTAQVGFMVIFTVHVRCSMGGNERRDERLFIHETCSPFIVRL